MTDDPIVGASPLKLGIFSSNADGGLALTKVPERWTAQWDDCLAAARIADDAGLDFILPIARWRGFGGETNAREWSFDTLTWAAALAVATRNITLFSTIHVPFLHPLFAAKALATIDQISNGRAALNIVCGWNPDEFAMFGMEPGADGYAQAAEWLDILERLYAAAAPFDYQGRFYDLKNIITRPVSVRRPRPMTMNAAFSPIGREFAARSCDQLFTTFSDIDEASQHVSDIRVRAAAANRAVGISTVCHVVCRETQAEAEDYYEHYAVREADARAVDGHMSKKKQFSGSHDDVLYLEHRKRFAGGAGTYPLVGTPAHIAEHLTRLSAIGYDGVALSFVNYRAELPFFCETVLPILQDVGVRTKIEPVTQD